MTPSGAVKTLHSFTGRGVDGLLPTAALIQGADGRLYGTTYGGGSQNKVVVFRLALGLPGHDFDGDGRTDATVFRPSSGARYQIRSGNGAAVGAPWGQNGDTPVAADYDGDGKADPAVFRGGTWYQLRSTTGAFGFVWGAAGDLPAGATLAATTAPLGK